MPEQTTTTLQPTARQTARDRVLAISAGGISIAMATVLSLIKLYKMPQGGSVTPASMLPILLYALCFGPGWGLAVGVVYGVVQLAVEPYWMNPLQVFFDYIAAFGLLGLAGFFAHSRAQRLAQPSILKRLGDLPFWRHRQEITRIRRNEHGTDDSAYHRRREGRGSCRYDGA